MFAYSLDAERALKHKTNNRKSPGTNKQHSKLSFKFQAWKWVFYNLASQV